MALNPIAYTENVVRSFLRYQLTAYPFADPGLHAQMRDLLFLDHTRQSPLLEGPYVSLSRPFRKGAAVDSLVDQGLLHPSARRESKGRMKNGVSYVAPVTPRMWPRSVRWTSARPPTPSRSSSKVRISGTDSSSGATAFTLSGSASRVLISTSAANVRITSAFGNCRRMRPTRANST